MDDKEPGEDRPIMDPDIRTCSRCGDRNPYSQCPECGARMVDPCKFTEELKVGDSVHVGGDFSYTGTVEMILDGEYAVKNDGDGWDRWHSREDLTKITRKLEGKTMDTQQKTSVSEEWNRPEQIARNVRDGTRTKKELRICGCESCREALKMLEVR